MLTLAVPQIKTTARKRPRQERAVATVEAILEATRRVLVKHGYEKASTNRIADVAGVSIGSLYQYFPNKQALIAALIDTHCDEIMRVLSARLAEFRDAEPREAARAMVAAMIGIHQINPKMHKVLIEQVPAVGKLKRIREVAREIEALLVVWLEARSSEVRRENSELVAFLLVRSVEAVTHAAVIERPDELGDELIDEITEMVARYTFIES